MAAATLAITREKRKGPRGFPCFTQQDNMMEDFSKNSLDGFP